MWHHQKQSAHAVNVFLITYKGVICYWKEKQVTLYILKKLVFSLNKAKLGCNRNRIQIFTNGIEIEVISGIAMLIFMNHIVHYLMFHPQIANNILKGTTINIVIYKNMGPSPHGCFVIQDSKWKTQICTKSACLCLSLCLCGFHFFY